MPEPDNLLMLAAESANQMADRLLDPWLPSLIALGGGVLTGLLVDGVVLSVLASMARKTAWQFDDIVIRHMRRVVFWVFSILGAKAAIIALPQKLLPNFLNAKMLGFIQHSLLVIAIAVTVWAIASTIVALIRHYSETAGILPSTSIFVNIVRAVILFLGLLVILQTLGISILPIVTALGVGGLAVSLALKDTLENIFAGLQIIFSKQIRVGDYVRLDNGQEGYAQDIGWRNTTIRQLSDNLVIVPNAKLASSIVINYSKRAGRMPVIIECTVGLTSNLHQVEALALQTAKSVYEELSDRKKNTSNGVEPKIRFSTFADLGIRFKTIFEVKDYNSQFMLTHLYIKRLQEVLLRHGIALVNMPLPVSLPESWLESCDEEPSSKKESKTNS